MKRPLQLAGVAPPSAKSRRRAEEDEALGGLRDPAASVRKNPQARRALASVATALDRCIAKDATLAEPVRRILDGGKSEGFTEAQVAPVRDAVLAALGLPPASGPSGAGLRPDVIEAACALSGDPDGILAEWLRSGAPLGVELPVTHSGVFPIDQAEAREDPESLPFTSTDSQWENYRSADQEMDTSRGILDKMVEKGWSSKYSSLGDAATALGADGLVLNKLGLISKVKPDGSMKHRLVWDLLRSGVNGITLQGERVVLPRIMDLVKSIAALAASRKSGEEIALLGTDIADAFHQVPLNSQEWKYTAASLGEDVYVFKVLVFGSVSAPTVWGRYAAWLGRTTCALIPEDRLRLHIYVDDPVYVTCGTAEQRALALTKALLWATVAGFPLAWQKCDGGASLTWIGAAVSVASGRTAVSIPEDKIRDMLETCSDMRRKNTVPSRQVRKLAGRGSFVAGLVPVIAPFLRSLWATGAKHAEGSAGDTPVRTPCAENGRGRPLPRHLVFVSQIKRDLSWLTAFLSRQRGTLIREHLWVPPPARHRLRICVDASPWGIGGVLMHQSEPVAFFADALQTQDLRRFQASTGDSAFNTVWEALAILVALRLWRPRLSTSGSFEIRSDSIGALGATLRCSSSAWRLNAVIAEIMLDEAEFSSRIAVLCHIPGISNEWPDALSRLTADKPKEFPPELVGVERSICGARGPEYWQTMGAWSAKKEIETPRQRHLCLIPVRAPAFRPCRWQEY